MLEGRSARRVPLQTSPQKLSHPKEDTTVRPMALRCICLALVPGVALAKAYFAGNREMVEKAECIAIVNIQKVEPANTKGRNWTYSQKATGIVERVLKGAARGEIALYGQEDFICARCTFQSGRHLLFLRKDADLWVGCNWQLSVRPIRDGKVPWSKDGGARFEQAELPLAEALADIERIVREEKK